MKNYRFLILIAFITVSTLAQSPLEQGKFQLNAGLGTSGWGTPIYVGLDYGIHQDITLGGELSYRARTYHYGNEKYRSSVTGIGVNGNYHFNRVLDMPSQWNLYAGLGLTYYIWQYENKSYKNDSASDLGLGLQVGGRYFFTKRFGINLELGGGNATNGAKIGITYKL